MTSNQQQTTATRWAKGKKGAHEVVVIFPPGSGSESVKLGGNRATRCSHVIVVHRAPDHPRGAGYGVLGLRSERGEALAEAARARGGSSFFDDAFVVPIGNAPGLSGPADVELAEQPDEVVAAGYTLPDDDVDHVVVDCSECGHQHFDETAADYVACPIDGCQCRYAYGATRPPEGAIAGPERAEVDGLRPSYLCARELHDGVDTPADYHLVLRDQPELGAWSCCASHLTHAVDALIARSRAPRPPVTLRRVTGLVSA